MRGREISVCGCLSHAPYWGPGPQPRYVCPDWELNQQPFGSQASAQYTEPHQPGQHEIFLRTQKRTNYKMGGQVSALTHMCTQIIPLQWSHILNQKLRHMVSHTWSTTNFQAVWVWLTDWKLTFEFLGCSNVVGNRILKSRQPQKISGYKGFIEPIHVRGYLYLVCF